MGNFFTSEYLNGDSDCREAGNDGSSVDKGGECALDKQVSENVTGSSTRHNVEDGVNSRSDVVAYLPPDSASSKEHFDQERKQDQDHDNRSYPFAKDYADDDYDDNDYPDDDYNDDDYATDDYETDDFDNNYYDCIDHDRATLKDIYRGFYKKDNEDTEVLYRRTDFPCGSREPSQFGNLLINLQKAERFANSGDLESANRHCAHAMVIIDTSSIPNKLHHYRQCLRIYEKIGQPIVTLRCYYKCRVMEIFPLGVDRLYEGSRYWRNLIEHGYSERIILETANGIFESTKALLDRGSVLPEIVSRIYIELSFTFERIMRDSKDARLRHTSSCHWENTISLSARLYFSMGHYSAVCDICKRSHDINLESFSILEIWARTLHRLGKYDLALKKAYLALQISSHDNKGTESLRSLVNELESSLEEQASAAKSDVIDYSWIQDTNVAVTERQRAKQQEIMSSHTKKKKRSRPKRMEVVQPEPEPAIKKEEAKDGRRAENLKTSRTSAEESNGLHREKRVPPVPQNAAKDVYDIQNFDKDDDLDDKPFLFDEDDAQTDLNSANDLVSIHDQVSRLMIKGISLKSRCIRSLAQGNYKYADYNEDGITNAEDDLLKRQPKKFKRCIIQIESAHKAICANLDSTDEIKEIEISGRSKCGKSFSEDEVLVEILKEEGKNQKDNFIPRLSKRPNQQTKQCKVYGAVKRTLKRNRFSDVSHPVLVCVVDEFECHLMKPLCRTIPKLYVQKRGAKEGFTVDIYEYTQSRKTVTFKEKISIPYADRHSFVFLVAYIKWDRYYPRGVVLRCIRTSGSLMNGISLLKLIHRVPGQCEESVLKVATSTASNETLNADEKRTDLSGLETFTIDPKDSTDLDDALSMEKLPNGLYRVGVHIADVSSGIQKDSTIDKAAQERLVTFYTGVGFEANHMLPSILSQHAFSLKQDRLRKTISVFFVLDKDGLPRRKPMIQKTLIRSRRQFSYTEVQDILDGKSDYFSNSIHDLYDLAISIRKIRLREEMYSPQLEEDNMDDLDNHELAKDAQLLVEEFMILANQFVGKFVVALFPDCVPLRCQDPPSQNELEEWKLRNDQIYDAVLRIQRILEDGKSISNLDLKLMRYNKILPFQKWIWNKLHEAVDSEDYNLASLLLGSDEFHPEQALALVEWFKIQEKGYYKCSGSIDGANEEHFSMHIMHYTHFTSPIRRYIDVMVHRLVHAAIEGNDCPYTQTEVQSLCKNVNEISRRANMYQRECMTLLWAYNIQKKPALLHVFAHDLTDADIGFHVPLKNVSSHSKKIPLSQLSPLKRPELKKDRETARDQVAVVWQKRIYSFSGYGQKTRHKKKDVKRIDPDQRAVFQQKKKWFQILQMLVHDHVTDLTKDFFDMNYHMSSSSRAQFNTEVDVSSEVRNGELIQQTCDFEMIFHHAQIISVQFMAAPIKGVLTPVPQLLDLTRNVKFCLEHMRDPVQVFERYATEKIRSKYASCAQYLSVVLPLLRMESAITAIQSATASINEVPVSFDNIGGQFTLLMSFCDRRDIDFNSMAMDFLVTGNEEDDEEIEYVPSSDYLCIRCDIQDGEMPGQRVDEACSPYKRMVWIGHGKIDKIKRMKKRGKVAVHFQLRKNSMMPTPRMQNKKKPVRCCVELLQKAEVERRSDAILQYLPKGSQLAMAIALGRKPPQMSKQHLDFVKSVGTEPEMFMTKQSKYPRNNPKQTEAIRNALEQSFSLIQGPPGTGKTYTGVKLIHLFCTMNRLAREAGLTQRQLVFCGPSNKSVDLVAKWILRIFEDKAPCMVRVYGSSMENMDFPIPGKVFPKKARSRDGKPDRKLQEVSLHHLIRTDHNQHAKEIRRYDKLFRENPAFSDIDEIKKYKSLLSKAVQEELTLYDVIFCTTAMATNHKFLKGTKGKIYQLIIDEAGMCTEPECVAPIIATQAKQVVLIGDHKQLRPTIMCQYAADLGLARSLFERYANKAVLLNMQYRMHPKICEFPSQTFYKGKLMTDMKHTSAWYEMYPLRVWPVFGTPHVFCHVVGTEEHLTVATEEGNELSRSNKAEVEVVVKIVAHLLDIERVNQEKINIMSQYNAQCYSLKDSLREIGLINLNINTVVASQGGEWDYVIFSTVRSLPQYRIEARPSLGWCKQNLGFITDAHQINVALTRARKGLIIVGNKNLLRCESAVWRPLLQHYGKQGCVMDAGEILKAF